MRDKTVIDWQAIHRRLEAADAAAQDAWMPGEAIKLNAAQFILPPEKIALLLVSLMFNRNKGVQA